MHNAYVQFFLRHFLSFWYFNILVLRHYNAITWQIRSVRYSSRKQKLWSMFKPTPRHAVSISEFADASLRTQALHRELKTRTSIKPPVNIKKDWRTCGEAENYFTRDPFKFIHSTNIYSLQRLFTRNESHVHIYLRSDFIRIMFK